MKNMGCLLEVKTVCEGWGRGKAVLRGQMRTTFGRHGARPGLALEAFVFELVHL